MLRFGLTMMMATLSVLSLFRPLPPGAVAATAVTGAAARPNLASKPVLELPAPMLVLATMQLGENRLLRAAKSMPLSLEEEVVDVELEDRDRDAAPNLVAEPSPAAPKLTAMLPPALACPDTAAKKEGALKGKHGSMAEEVLLFLGMQEPLPVAVFSSLTLLLAALAGKAAFMGEATFAVGFLSSSFLLEEDLVFLLPVIVK